jgi:hypothetical protein
MLVEQKSTKTIEEYGRKVAALSLHFKSLPERMTDTQIDGYPAEKIGKEGSNSMFKHIVFGLRFYFSALGLERQQHHLPSIKKSHKLPQILILHAGWFCALHIELRQEFSVNNPRIYPGAEVSPLSFYPVRVTLENEGIRQLLRSWNLHCIDPPQMNLGVIYRQRLWRFMHNLSYYQLFHNQK